MILMLKDIPVLEINPDKYIFNIYREDLLPFYLKYRLDTNVRSGILEDAWKIIGNIRYVQDFLSSRVLPLSRKNAKKIYNLYTNNQSDKLRVSIMCRGVSLLDNYWVTDCNSDVKWSDVSIRDNPLNEIFTQIALRGSSLSLQGSMMSPETTTNGTYAKGWKRDNGKLYLYKKGYESHLEVMVSNLLDIIGVNHVKYVDAEDNGEYCCKCECMTSDDVSIVDAGTIESLCNRREISFIEFTRRHYSDDLYKMWIVDYLIANSDRHSQNWGFIYDADTTDILGLHPLFDHNNAFDVELMKTPDMQYIANNNMTMREAAHYAIKRVHIQPSRSFTRNDFMTKRQYDCFMSRLNELGI